MEYSLLTQLVSLFDAVTDKPCPVTASRAPTLPSSELCIKRAVRDGTGALDVSFTLTHSFRELSEADAEAAVGYLSRLCEAAEATRRARVISVSGVEHGADGVTAVVRARFNCRVSDGARLTLGGSALALWLLGVEIECRELITERRYLENATPVRERIGEDVTLRVTTDAAGGSSLREALKERAHVECTAGSTRLSGEFVLESVKLGETAVCTLRSSGEVTLDTVEANSEKGDRQ